MRRVLAVLAAAGCLGGCASLAAGATCAPDEDRRDVAELYFGRNIGDRPGVTAEEFDAFAQAEIAPRFPEGFTVIDAEGRWGSVREASKTVRIVLAGHADERRKLAAIAGAYKTRFRQESVLRVITTACVSF